MEKRETFLATISRAMSRYRVMARRRVIGRHILSKAAPKLDLPHVEVIELVDWKQRKGEVTIGMIADKMRLDPSRASRIVSALVEEGLFQRNVSQADARCAIIELTDKGREILEDKKQAKKQLISQLFAEWSEEDMETFSRLYERFVDDMERVVGAPRGKDQ